MLGYFFIFLVFHTCASVNSRDHDHMSETLENGKYRIISGREADISEFPYQAMMEHFGQQWCGATIATDSVLITAAHCVQPILSYTIVPEMIMRVRVGTSVAETGGVVHAIFSAIDHERYDEDPEVDEHDIALLFLVTPLVFNSKVKPIPYTDVEPVAGEMSYVTGFGRQEPMRRKLIDNKKRHLMAIEIPIYDWEDCRRLQESYGNKVTKLMICAGYRRGSKDSCKGDSGGPLVINNTLVGVVAWGLGCGRDGIPGVYTNVARYSKWLDDKIGAFTDTKRRMYPSSRNAFLRMLFDA